MTIPCYIAIGSNLNQPLAQVQKAVQALSRLPHTELLGVSHWYRSAPLGPPGQPDYINGVAVIATAMLPQTLLAYLQGIERAQGRLRGQRWGPRTLDLDILLYGNKQIQSDELSIPHPEMTKRNFVLYPLADVAPYLVLPDGTELTALLAKVPPEGIVRLPAGEERGSTGQRP